MTENQSPLFDVQIDDSSKSYLIEIAKWDSAATTFKKGVNGVIKQRKKV